MFLAKSAHAFVADADHLPPPARGIRQRLHRKFPDALMVEGLLRSARSIEESQPFGPVLSSRSADGGITAWEQRDIDGHLRRFAPRACTRSRGLRFPFRLCGPRFAFWRRASSTPHDGCRGLLRGASAPLRALGGTCLGGSFGRLAPAYFSQSGLLRRWFLRRGNLFYGPFASCRLFRRTGPLRPTRLLGGHGCASADAAATRQRRVLLRAHAGSTTLEKPCPDRFFFLRERRHRDRPERTARYRSRPTGAE